MKILALAPINQNKMPINSTKKNLYLNKTVNCDSVSFHAGKKKAAETLNPKVLNGFLENIGGELGEKVKELMTGKESRPVFMTMLVSLAAAATDLILKNNSKNKTTDNETKENDTSDKSNMSDTDVTVKKTGRKSIVDKMGKKTFVAKLQDMTDNGYTLTQMSGELENISIFTVKKYLKEFGIKPKKSAEKGNNAKPAARQTKEEKLTEFINARPYRNEYLKKLEEYPAILEQYKKALSNSATNSKDEYNKNVLSGMEKIFSNLFELKSKHNKPYLVKFNSLYGNNFDKVSIILNDIAPYKTLQECLADFKDNDYSEELINKWTNYPAFTPEELDMAEELPSVNKQKIHELKKEKAFSFQLIKNKDFHYYGFKLSFADNMDLSEKLKTISAFHEALYDNIYLSKDKGNSYQRIFDLKEELLTLVKKDKNLDSVYNILKYIAPKKMEEVNYQTEQYMPVNELEVVNAENRKKMENIIKNLDVKNNTRLDEIEDIMINSDMVFRNLIGNNHAKLRFISRFVLNKKVPDGTLYENCSLTVEKLEKQIDKKLKNGCMIFPYIMNESTAPSFFLDRCSLGNFIKITLNNQGQIHTIFEDLKRKTGYRQ